MTKKLSYSTEEEYIDVKIDGKDYILKEASGGAAVNWKNALFARVKEVDPNTGKPKSFGNLADLEPYLVSMCLFDEKNQRVSEKKIKSWPQRIQKELYQEALSISEMSDNVDPNEFVGSDSEDPAKNEQSDTATGS